MLKLFKPFVSQQSINLVNEVLVSGQLAQGSQVDMFEKELEETLGIKNVVTLNSGTSALELAYELAGINEGDEVITPVLTCTATNLPLIHRKAKIIFADIDHDLNINIEDVKKKVTSNTKAIVFVHFGGNNRGLSELLDYCKERGIVLIEDAAQAISSTFWGKADFTCVSLQAIKTVTAGDGGILLCKSEEDYKKAKLLRWFGINREEKQKGIDVDVELAGYKYHMNDISAAIGRGNLAYLDILKAHQEKLAKVYKSYGLFAYTWLAGGFTDKYDELKQKLSEAGYEMGQHHYRNDKYTVFGGRQKFQVMDEVELKYFFVPFHFGVSIDNAHEIGKIYKTIENGK